MIRSALLLGALAVGCAVDSTGLRNTPGTDAGPRSDASGLDGAVDRMRDGSVDGGSEDAVARRDATERLDATESGGDAGGCRADPVPPGSGMCPEECTGGCDSGVCTIDCRGFEACDDPAIVCPPEYACVVRCAGIDACDDGTITCPPDFACTLECGAGTNACGSLELQCGNASCTVDCSAGDCRTLTVSCPPGGACADCG